MAWCQGCTTTEARRRLPEATHKGLPVFQSQSHSYRERTHDGYACVERSKAEGIKQRAGRCHNGHAIAHGPEPPLDNSASSASAT
eukprot:131977-Chlamydomonas_euryale.AAC.2